MIPPQPHKVSNTGKRSYSYSRCFACEKWKMNNNIFHHDGRHWVLCRVDYVDYWENTDELLPDYKGFP